LKDETLKRKLLRKLFSDSFRYTLYITQEPLFLVYGS